MKRFYILAMGLAGMILATSCSNEEKKDIEPVVQQPVQLVFQGVQSDGGADTKSYLDGGSVYWNTYDAINVFAAGSSYRFDTKEGGATVTFVGVVLSEDINYFGLYPYNGSASYSYDSSNKEITYNTTFPSSQEALANSFAKDANITVATTNNNDMTFHFKNVCGLIKFRITSNAETLLFTKAVLEGNNSENIAGAIRIVYDSDAEVSSTNPSVDDIGTETAITLNAPTGSYLLKDTDYYIAVPPRTFPNGYKITFYKGETPITPSWTVTDVSATVIRSKILNANTYTYTAVTNYTITASPDDMGNGTVSKSPDGGTYLEGTMVTLTATPNEGKGFTQWSDGNKDNPRTVLVDSNKSFTAEFDNAYSITASPDNVSNGFVSISPAPNGANGKYINGTSVTLTATPVDGKGFTQWSDGNKDNPRTVLVDSDKNLTASFANAYSITATPDNVNNGSVSISPAPNAPGGKYVYGTTVTLTATPAEGKVFTEWSDGNTDNPRTFNVDSNKNLTASFANAP